MNASCSIARSIVALVAGALFGFGLAVAQMTDPLKVLGFLDFAGAWDASLFLVLCGAVAVSAIIFHFVLRRPAPVFDDRFHLAAIKQVDIPLIAGAVLFGIGWGLAGYCPGPALASLSFANPEAWWFVPAMLAGAGLHRWQARQRTRRQER